MTDYAALRDAIEQRLREMQDEHAPLCACIRCEHLPALVGWALEMVADHRAKPIGTFGPREYWPILDSLARALGIHGERG